MTTNVTTNDKIDDEDNDRRQGVTIFHKEGRIMKEWTVSIRDEMTFVCGLVNNKKNNDHTSRDKSTCSDDKRIIALNW